MDTKQGVRTVAKKSKMAKTNWGGVIGILIIVAGAAWVLGFLEPYGFPAPEFATGGQYQPNGAVGAVYTGEVTFNVKPWDALDITTARTEGTNMDHTWCLYESGKYNCFASGNAQTHEVKASNGGRAYVIADYKSGQNFTLDIDLTKSMNGDLVTRFLYFDIDQDGAKERVFELDTSDLKASEPGATSAKIYFLSYWYSHTKTTLNSPSDITGIGTTAGTPKWIEWKYTFGTTKQGTGITRLELKFNTTSTSKWIPSESFVTLWNGQKIYMTEMDFQNDGTNVYYIKEIGNKEFPDAINALYGTANVDNFPIDTKLVLNLAAADVIGVTLNTEDITPSGAYDTHTDEVTLTQA